MNLHLSKEAFLELITLTSNYRHIPEQAVKRDYFIVMILGNLSESVFKDRCVFKGGTSLSKCYPNTIERFSEDIDLTFLPLEGMAEKQIDRELKKIETILSTGFKTEKIDLERNARNKSSFVWMEGPKDRVKLEIGSSVKPEPYSKKTLKTYIQDFLESRQETEDIHKFGLQAYEVQTLDITRTFIDKVMSVKRHAICGTLEKKVRHIYDVVKLFRHPEIQSFMKDKDVFKKIVALTKFTDSFYLEKREIPQSYQPTGFYDFDAWKETFSVEIRRIYEKLHEDLLYTKEKQDFNEALSTFSELNQMLKAIGE